jgi:hypothetical protein
MTTKYNRNFDFTYPFTDTGVMMLLVASTALAYTVPGTPNQIYRAKFSVNATVDVWVQLNGTATLPTSGVATATRYQEKIDGNGHMVKYVKGGDTLSFISTGTPQVGVSLLMVQDIT